MWKTFLMSCIMMLSVSGVALAHFGMVIPSAGTVTDKKDADVTLRPGDRVRILADGFPALENPVVAEGELA